MEYSEGHLNDSTAHGQAWHSHKIGGGFDDVGAQPDLAAFATGGSAILRRHWLSPTVIPYM